MSEHTMGKCSWCGEQGEVFRDNLRCDDCDSNVCRCSICRQDYHCDNTCRHIFQDEHFEWRGAGVRTVDHEMQYPFHLLLSAMGEEFARDLRGAIVSRKFYTWLIAPMIGGGGMLELNGMDHRRTYGDAMIRLGQGNRAKELADGYRWLASLYKGKTIKANLATISWIDQWLWPLTPVDRLTRSDGAR